MKKYHTLGEFLIDYRKHRKISQLDFAGILGIDARTVIRWEKNETLIKVEKEILLIEKLGIPHQVIRNLNTNKPISIYFDFQKWGYSLSFLSKMVTSAWDYKRFSEVKTDRIQTISKKKDLEYIYFIQKNHRDCDPIKEEVIMAAAEILPDLNLVMRGHSDYHAGHISILPLKYKSYLQLRDKEKLENQLTVKDLNTDFEQKPLVFYFYSLYANSLDNTYYIMNQGFDHFKTRRYEDYILAGISYRQAEVDRLNEVGLKVVWEENMEEDAEKKATFTAGNLDEFLFSN